MIKLSEVELAYKGFTEERQRELVAASLHLSQCHLVELKQ
ncbi:hypothetical protein PALB_36820 [Pseudoalteromonas luteoviolacea B = ATCC 29581]|nr:hypothetical protein PALB_36820 [Pseudoalteromonas luteoviolacea B = ATCC 29581]